VKLPQARYVYDANSVGGREFLMITTGGWGWHQVTARQIGSRVELRHGDGNLMFEGTRALLDKLIEADYVRPAP